MEDLALLSLPGTYFEVTAMGLDIPARLLPYALPRTSWPLELAPILGAAAAEWRGIKEF